MIAAFLLPFARGFVIRGRFFRHFGPKCVSLHKKPRIKLVDITPDMFLSSAVAYDRITKKQFIYSCPRAAERRAGQIRYQMRQRKLFIPQKQTRSVCKRPLPRAAPQRRLLVVKCSHGENLRFSRAATPLRRVPPRRRGIFCRARGAWMAGLPIPPLRGVGA